MSAGEPVDEEEAGHVAEFRNSLAQEMYEGGRCESWEQAVRLAEIRLMAKGYRAALAETGIKMANEVEEFLKETGSG